MPVSIVVGAQWGDEGKGKIIDVLSENARAVLRYQGGANAGHTVFVGKTKYVLHLIPSGILRPDVVCIIGDGVVLDPLAFKEELDMLHAAGIETVNRLWISPRTHIVLPYHKRLDQCSEKRKGDNKIGTTGRGIGPAYMDKYYRMGLRAIDLLNPHIRRERILRNLEMKNFMLRNYFDEEPLDTDTVLEQAEQFARILKPYVRETVKDIAEMARGNEHLLVEGAQGAMLDIDYGSYPYVTSSHPVAGGAFTGSGLGPFTGSPLHIYGVAKAYLTRVGNGPFPTELNDNAGAFLRDRGHEYGATTGRPRRCGWLDLVALKYSVLVNGMTRLAVTKLDVLDAMETIRVCTRYSLEGKTVDFFPADPMAQEKVVPRYVEFDGWRQDTSQCTEYKALPEKAKNYLKFIEDFLGIPITIISNGQRRDQIIHV